jgi:transglutaminase-like putative cysteine protease
MDDPAGLAAANRPLKNASQANMTTTEQRRRGTRAARWPAIAFTSSMPLNQLWKSNAPRVALSIAIGLLPCVRGAVRAEDAPPDPNLPYQAQRSNPVAYDVDFSVVVTPPYKTKLLRVWVPLPPSDAGQEVTEGELSTFPLDVRPTIAAEETFGNRFACFEFVNPQGAQIIRHRFQVKVWELRWNLDPARVARVSEWPASFDRYRRGDSQAVIVDERFQRLMEQIVPRPGNPLDDLSVVLDWVGENFQYDHDQASLAASAAHGLEFRRGHCSDYHGFCASMGRVLGCPTRVTYGINPFPKNSPSHCKLEAYLHPYGWVSFDVSETQKLQTAIRADAALDDADRQRLSAAASRRLISGFRDNTWFVQTRGTDYDLAPPASRRVPVVRTAFVEADGVPLPDPDPSSQDEQAFSWMTVHKYVPDRDVKYPFQDYGSLDVESPTGPPAPTDR